MMSEKPKKQRRDEVLYKTIIERMIEIRSSYGHTQEYVCLLYTSDAADEL
mgnify:CR=1 FL=1